MTELEWLKLFGDNLKRMLDNAWMSQIELSKVTGISKGAISCYVHGTKIPNATSLLKMAYALSCTVDDLIDFGETIER